MYKDLYVWPYIYLYIMVIQEAKAKDDKKELY